MIAVETCLEAVELWKDIHDRLSDRCPGLLEQPWDIDAMHGIRFSCQVVHNTVALTYDLMQTWNVSVNGAPAKQPHLTLDDAIDMLIEHVLGLSKDFEDASVFLQNLINLRLIEP